MNDVTRITIDGNEAAAYIAHLTNEVVAIYPITPASPMGEWADEWSALGQTQPLGHGARRSSRCRAKAGAAGAVHGALQAGALATTFTASQGLLLMIPNMYKIAGELTPMRAACRRTCARGARAVDLRRPLRRDGGALAPASRMLCSARVQEAMDFALIAQAATLEGRVPFVHFFDGFRTSHEVARSTRSARTTVRHMIDEDLIVAHRERALSPDHPVIRGTSQNPDVYFQGREAANLVLSDAARCGADATWTASPRYRQAVPAVRLLRRHRCRPRHRHDGLGHRSGRGGRGTPGGPRRAGRHPEGTPVPALRRQRTARGDPADGDPHRRARPHQRAGRRRRTTLQGRRERHHGRLDPGRFSGEALPRVVGGRYGLGSKEFTPAMVAGVFDELAQAEPEEPLHRRHRRRPDTLAASTCDPVVPAESARRA